MDLIERDFFDRPSDEVAPALLGCVLEHETDEGLVAVELTEVEAYAGETDPASHAYRGMTGRNAVMFGPPGHAYVYFTYGMHFCVNVVCMPEGIARAVLLRAGRVVAGEPLARLRRAGRRTETAPAERHPRTGPRPRPGAPLPGAGDRPDPERRGPLLCGLRASFAPRRPGSPGGRGVRLVGRPRSKQARGLG